MDSFNPEILSLIDEELFKNILTNNFEDTPRDIQYLFDHDYIRPYYKRDDVQALNTYKVMKEFTFDNILCTPNGLLTSVSYARRFDEY